MEQISALIVDDERLCRKRIQSLLSGEPGIEVIGECASAEDALSQIRQRMPDLLFLDIQMPDMDGFEVLKRTGPEPGPVTIFVTAHGDHALKAFEARAFDYLLKPFDRDRFRDVLKRAMAQVSLLRGGDMDRRLAELLENFDRGKPQRDRIAVRTSGRVILLKTEKIDWVEAADNYVCLHCGGENHVLRYTMNALETQLDPAQFLRIHRSTIVNIDRIKELQPWFRGDYRVILQDETKLVLSRSYRDVLRTRLLRNGESM